MNIKWLGHSSFLITTGDNVRIITDPYSTGNGINYGPVNEAADIVTVSHGHGDHNNIKAVKGNPSVLQKAGSHTVRGIEFNAVPVFHDGSRGSQRGNNLVFCFKADGLNLCHLGDLGHTLSGEQISHLGPVDVLFIPVGGYFTIDAAEASSVAQSIKPGVIIPMHYKTPKCDYPISPVDDFLQGKPGVRRVSSSEVSLSRDALPGETEIIVLQPAL
jgi:L-ascorbate metabolism protein UlaG (beta-lactamase superfamily)